LTTSVSTSISPKTSSLRRTVRKRAALPVQLALPSEVTALKGRGSDGRLIRRRGWDPMAHLRRLSVGVDSDEAAVAIEREDTVVRFVSSL